MKSKFVIASATATVVAALCCFTPVLPLVLTALGLAGLIDTFYNDAVLLPILGFFAVLTALAVWREKRRN